MNRKIYRSNILFLVLWLPDSLTASRKREGRGDNGWVVGRLTSTPTRQEMAMATSTRPGARDP